MAVVVALFITTVFSLAHFTPLISLEEEQEFKLWMLQHNKVYDAEEYSYRLHIFTANKRRIDLHNAGNHSYTTGLNQFSDMTFEEFKEIYLLPDFQFEPRFMDDDKDFNNHGSLGVTLAILSLHLLLLLVWMLST